MITYKTLKKNKVSNPVVSIVIRCKNESKKITDCLDILFNQKLEYSFEIIVIDSGSTDGTLDIIKDYNISIYTITPKDFNYGTSINLGVNLSRGKYCVFVSAHAIPKNEEWLSGLVKPMVNDCDIAGTYSRQIPYDDTFFIEKRALSDTFGPYPKLQKIYQGDSKKTIRDNMVFSNASSCIRKSLALKYPFKNLPASEDREWALRVLREGYKISYEPSSIIFHAHNETPQQYYKRIFINSKALFFFFGIKIGIRHLIPLFLYQILKDIRYCKKNNIQINLSILKKSIVYRFYYVKAHYLGTRKDNYV